MDEFAMSIINEDKSNLTSRHSEVRSLSGVKRYVTLSRYKANRYLTIYIFHIVADNTRSESSDLKPIKLLSTSTVVMSNITKQNYNTKAITLTPFSSMVHSYTQWKRQKTFGFLLQGFLIDKFDIRVHWFSWTYNGFTRTFVHAKLRVHKTVMVAANLRYLIYC